ncbi:unnamed protein product [Leptosia nina]|uniref:Inter-alpha-trypsin inhibitor heavy chain H4-like n=1 Tax=Leptosia nina TaxID=320188 RepID=A0AAV1JHI7_9NEOP
MYIYIKISFAKKNKSCYTMGDVRWKCILLCVGLFIATVSSAAITQDPLIVTTGDDITTETNVGPTTDEPNAPIKLTEMRVHSEIALRYARTAVVTTVRNPAKRSQEAVFRMLLPETAFISGFVMTLNGKSYKAYVKGKEEAKQIYNEAVSQGFGAAHVSAKARDSNHFTVNVNVEPNTTAVFNLTYEELLVRRNGVYNHAINLHPGALVPKLKVTVHIKETEKITTLRVPEVKTGNEVDATDADAQNPIAAIDRGHDDREATITFKPDLIEQRRLIDVYSAKSKESAASRPYYFQHNVEDNQEGTIGQFIVQYDVDRTNNKDILVNDGYFVHFLAPSSLPPLKKHVVFVLDTSGSMMGHKLDQLREAMQTILGKLYAGDYFSIVEFNSDVVVHDLKEADAPPAERKHYWNYQPHQSENTALVPPSRATPENIEKAKTIISRLQSFGGTNIHSALSVAIDLIRKGVDWKVKSNESKPDSTTAAPEQGKALTVDEGVKNELEPIVIFLTDGDPTEGETSTVRIINHLSEKNYGEKKASIFSLAFGEDADRNFLRKLSLRNEGFMRHIYEAADAALQLRDFYQQVSSPLLSNVHFTYPKDQVKEGSVTRSKFHAVFAGSEVVVAGRVLDNVDVIEAQVDGFCAVDDGSGKKKYAILPKIPVSTTKNEYMPLERLWAYLTIKQLLDEKDASDSDDKSEKSPEKRALAIALKYEFVTPLTSLVVVKPNATNAVNAESVDNQRPEYSAFGSYGPPSLSAGYGQSNALSAVSFSQPIATLQHQFGLPGPPMQEPVFDDIEAEEIDNRYEDEDRADMDSFPVSSIFGAPPALSTTSAPKVELPKAEPASPLMKYNLQDFGWAENLLDASADVLKLSVNGTQVDLKLYKTGETVTEGEDSTCDKAGGGVSGACVYITRCRSAKTITSQQYQELYCTVGNGYAGVCCPSDDVDKA